MYSKKIDTYIPYQYLNLKSFLQKLITLIVMKGKIIQTASFFTLTIFNFR